MLHRHLDDEITELRNLLIEMSNLVDEQLADAINAVSTCNVAEADRIRRRDDEVDALEIRIDDQCERLLALHTPVAVDLRAVISAVKVNTDLERIGDQAKNVAKQTRYLVSCSGLIQQTGIQEMADLARTLLHEAQDAFIRRDRVLARKVLAHDRQVDRLHDETVQTLIRLVQENPANAEAVLHLMTMSKSVERIADHSKNIAERVVFMVEGTDIRHPKLAHGEENGE